MVVDVTPSRKVEDRSPRPSSAQIPPKSQLRSQVEHRLSLARAGSTVWKIKINYRNLYTPSSPGKVVRPTKAVRWFIAGPCPNSHGTLPRRISEIHTLIHSFKTLRSSIDTLTLTLTLAWWVRFNYSILRPAGVSVFLYFCILSTLHACVCVCVCIYLLYSLGVGGLLQICCPCLPYRELFVLHYMYTSHSNSNYSANFYFKYKEWFILS